MAVSAFTAGGAFYDLHDEPPYPINTAMYANVLDGNVLNKIFNALLKSYDELKLNELGWSYWYARCAPVHMSPAHFGALIEQLQRNASKAYPKIKTGLLDADAWAFLKRGLLSLLDDTKIDPTLKPIMKGKLSSLNQIPQGTALKLLFDALQISLTDFEVRAWKHRHQAAHGSINDNAIDVILNTKVLKIMFHRLLAGLTSCSDRYIDYFNFDFPVRSITEGIPERF
jgi:hypothetical protein